MDFINHQFIQILFNQTISRGYDFREQYILGWRGALLSIIAVLIGYFFKKKMPTIFEIFIIVLLMELPLSLKGYEIKPDASVIERMIVAGVFGSFSYALSEAILSKTPLIKL